MFLFNSTVCLFCVMFFAELQCHILDKDRLRHTQYTARI